MKKVCIILLLCIFLSSCDTLDSMRKGGVITICTGSTLAAGGIILASVTEDTTIQTVGGIALITGLVTVITGIITYKGLYY